MKNYVSCLFVLGIVGGCASPEQQRAEFDIGQHDGRQFYQFDIESSPFAIDTAINTQGRRLCPAGFIEESRSTIGRVQRINNGWPVTYTKYNVTVSC